MAGWNRNPPSSGCLGGRRSCGGCRGDDRNRPPVLLWAGGSCAAVFGPALFRRFLHGSSACPDPSDERYPVLYWLHGAGGNENATVADLAPLVQQAVADGAIPPLIVVFANGGPGTFYVDSWNGAHQVETAIVEELLPHVDATYRTISSRAQRAISGMSMGGHGALALAVKHPDLFSSVVAYAPALVELTEQPDGSYLTSQRGATADLPTAIKAQVVQEMFNGDPTFFERHNLWSLVPRRAAELRGRLAIRLVVGDADPFCFVSNSEFHDLLNEHGLEHEFEIVPGVEHDQPALLEAIGRAGLLFHAREARDW